MTTLSLPEDAGIFLAQYQGSVGNIVTLESHLAPTTETLSKKYHHMLDTHGYAGTFIIGHVALQVFAFRRGQHLVRERLGFVLPDTWDLFAPQIMPISGPVSWPPKYGITDRWLKRFATRWAGMGLFLS
jgi:hypothetical protein